MCLNEDSKIRILFVTTGNAMLNSIQIHYKKHWIANLGKSLQTEIKRRVNSNVLRHVTLISHGFHEPCATHVTRKLVVARVTRHVSPSPRI